METRLQLETAEGSIATVRSEWMMRLLSNNERIKTKVKASYESSPHDQLCKGIQIQFGAE